jgi:hypothetical protein
MNGHQDNGSNMNNAAGRTSRIKRKTRGGEITERRN